MLQRLSKNDSVQYTVWYSILKILLIRNVADPQIFLLWITALKPCSFFQRDSEIMQHQELIATDAILMICIKCLYAPYKTLCNKDLSATS